TAHAFPDENCRPAVAVSRLGQRFAVRCDQPRQGIGPPQSLLHIGVIKSYNIANGREQLLPSLHPGMRRWCPGPWSEKKEGARHLNSRPLREPNESTSRSRKGHCAAFIFFLASSREKKLARSISG